MLKLQIPNINQCPHVFSQYVGIIWRLSFQFFKEMKLLVICLSSFQRMILPFEKVSDKTYNVPQSTSPKHVGRIDVHECLVSRSGRIVILSGFDESAFLGKDFSQLFGAYGFVKHFKFTSVEVKEPLTKLAHLRIYAYRTV